MSKRFFTFALAFLVVTFLALAADDPPQSFQKGGKYGYRDRKSKAVVIEPQYDYAADFSEGLAAVGVGAYPDTKWGYIDAKGKTVIEPKFEAAREFSEERAAVMVKGKLGYIDRTGKIIAEPRFDEAQPFKDGKARVRIVKEGYGYINKQGEVIEPLTQ